MTWKSKLTFLSIPPERCYSEEHSAGLCIQQRKTLLTCLSHSRLVNQSPLSRTNGEMQAVCSSKLQPGMAASRGHPSLPWPTATSSFLLWARISNYPSTGRIRFIFSKYNKYNKKNGNQKYNWKYMSHICVTPEQGRVCPSSQDHQCAAAAAETPYTASFRGAQGLFLIQPCVVQQHSCPLNTQLETSLSEQKPRKSKRKTNYCSDLDSYLGLSLWLWKWKSQGLRSKQIKYKLLLP